MMQMLLCTNVAGVYGLPVDSCLWAAGEDGVKLLNAYQRIAQTVKFSRSPARLAAPANALPSPEQVAVETLSAVLSTGQAVDLDGIYPSCGKHVRQPPAVQLVAQEHQRKWQHPVYSTSNNAYGSKAPSLHELPLSWHGIRGDFTRKQATGKVVTTGLKTAISNHAVSDALHEIGF